jgi:hypothetical protein
MTSTLGLAHATLSVMELFPLRDPGHHLVGLPLEQRARVDNLLYTSRNHLADATVGLELYTRAASQAPARWDSPDERAWEARRHTLERLVPPNVPIWERAVDAAWQVITERAELGEMPRDYAFRLPFIYAHTVAYALDGVEKTLGVLAQEQPALPPEVAQAHADLLIRLPAVKPVRDSAHHLEDRVRGLKGMGPNKKPIQLQPIANGLINAPQGALLIDNLLNGRLGFTGSDGAYHEVEISSTTIDIARDAIQRVINALTWEGPPRIFPYR